MEKKKIFIEIKIMKGTSELIRSLAGDERWTSEK